MTIAQSSLFSETKSDDLAISTFDIFEMKMSNVMIVKSSLLVSEKSDNLAIVTFSKCDDGLNRHIHYSQTLPQSQTQTQAKKTHEMTTCALRSKKHFRN